MQPLNIVVVNTPLDGQSIAHKKNIVLNGALDFEDVPYFQELLGGLIDKETYELEIDCTLLTDIHVRGLMELIKLAKKIHDKNGKIVLLAVNDKLMEVLSRVGLVNAIECHRALVPTGVVEA